MITIQFVKEKISQYKVDLVHKYHLNYIAVFGSVSRGDNNENSDVDILVDFSEPIGIEFIDLADELETILSHRGISIHIC